MASANIKQISVVDLKQLTGKSASFLLLVVVNMLEQHEWQQVVQHSMRHLVLALPGGGFIATTAEAELPSGLYVLKGTLVPRWVRLEPHTTAYVFAGSLNL